MLSEKILTIDSDSSKLKMIRDEVDLFIQNKNLSEKAREEILVAMGEATANCVRHAYQNEKGHEVRVTLQDYEDKVVFRIRDFGKKIDPKKIDEKPQLPPVKPNGLGIFFMKKIMDGFEYITSHAEGNEVVLTKFKQNHKEQL